LPSARLPVRLVLCLLFAWLTTSAAANAQVAQPVPPATPQAPAAAPEAVERAAAAEPQDPQPAPRRGRRARGGSDSPAASSQAPAGAQDAKKPARKQKPQPGIPVDDVLVQSFCGRCHQRDDRNHMTRISYVRKSPEGWSRTIKRMGRLHGLQLTPDAAKGLVRSLANSHGLARKEAERGLYDSERRVHWSEEHHDEDFRRACAQCHPLGRALLQHRSKEEWQLLRATHVAMFPGARRQIGGGPPSERRSRSFPGGGGEGGDAGGNDPRRARGNVGDRVLEQLAKDQPLFTPEWDAWSRNDREVPLAGRWTVTGHETGRGDLIGSVQITRDDVDEYSLQWQLRFTDGTEVARVGKGILYAGYSWRSSSTEKDIGGKDGDRWRDVLLLDDAWQTLRGRSFRGAYDEIGVDLVLHRDSGHARVIALGNAAIEVPTTGHRLEVYGERFASDCAPTDFFVGDGLTVTAVEFVDERHVTLLVDSAKDSVLGTRTVAYGPHPGTAKVTLYDTVDYVRIRPLQGLARIGGEKHPKQFERFEAYAVHRGKDRKPFTDDDVDLFQVRPTWALAELHVREDDDDLQFVGTIDAQTGVFTPNVDGPNEQRKWQANNIGDVFVTCEVELDVAVRKPEPTPKGEEGGAGEASGDGAQEGEPEGEGEAAEGGEQGDETAVAEEVVEETAAEADPDADEQDPAAAAAPPKRERKTFRARTHLIVTVPLYARWNVLDWEDR